jgi:HEAT repeat protein
VIALAAIGITLLVVSSELWTRYSSNRTRMRAWHEAAESLGLKGVPARPVYLSRPALTGWAGGRRVRFELDGSRERGEGTRIIVGGTSLIGLRPEGLGTRLGKAFGNPEVQIGDAGFDADVYVSDGAVEVLRAVLTPPVRAALRGLFRQPLHLPGDESTVKAEVSVQDGEIRARLSDAEHRRRPRALAELTRMLLELAPSLDAPVDPVARIAQNTLGEPEWRVRLANIRLLSNRFPSRQATRDALVVAVRDAHPEVRLQAAFALGEEGEQVLLDLASKEPIDDFCAAQAIAELGRRLPPDRALEILGNTLRRRHMKAALACLESLGSHGGPAVVDPLGKVLAVETGELAAAAAVALGRSRAPQAEAPLLHALQRGPSIDVRVAIAVALAEVGSTDAVLPLQQAAELQDADAALRRAVRQAIAEIQSRLPGASPGQLSLAGGEAGQVSLAGEDPAGRVSLAERDSGTPRQGPSQ